MIEYINAMIKEILNNKEDKKESNPKYKLHLIRIYLQINIKLILLIQNYKLFFLLYTILYTIYYYIQL